MRWYKSEAAYSSSVGRASHKTLPRRTVLIMKMVDILSIALNINLREFGEAPDEWAAP